MLSINRNTSLPVGVRMSNPSWTLTNTPPASRMRSIAASPSTSDRPNRSSRATTSPFRLAPLDPAERLQQQRPVAPRARFHQALEDALDLRVMESRPAD